jgi:hypothetical protein
MEKANGSGPQRSRQSQKKSSTIWRMPGILMMNIAIILAIPHYDKIAALPGCAGDGRAIQTLLAATKRFSEQLIVNDTRADHAREQIINFLEKYHNEHVDEMLFYYSGHGYIADDFLCCASDFDPNRPQSTSISNKELDDLFRELNLI